MPKVGPYIYIYIYIYIHDVNISGFARSSIYIYAISRLGLNMVHWQFEMREKILPTTILGYTFMYLQIKH
jgi:hypothetical protein